MLLISAALVAPFIGLQLVNRRAFQEELGRPLARGFPRLSVRRSGCRPAPLLPRSAELRLSLRVTQLLCVLGVSFCSGSTVGSQATDATALSGPLRTHIQDERFQTVTSTRGLPLGVRDALQGSFGSVTLDMADPGAPFQVSDAIINPNLPTRRLVAAGCSTDHCLVYFERGGIAHMWQVVLYHWTPDGTRLEWGGAAPGGLATLEDVRKAILSGEIKGRQP